MISKFILHLVRIRGRGATLSPPAVMAPVALIRAALIGLAIALRLNVFLLLFGIGMFPAAAVYADSKAAAEPFVILYMQFDNDALYQPRRAYTGLTLSAPTRALDGVRLGVRENRLLRRSINVAISVEEVHSTADQDFVGELKKRLAETGSGSVLLDLPKAAMLQVVDALRESSVLFFNARLQDNDLRVTECRVNLFHSIPSRLMLTDALSQYLKAKGWDKALSLSGPLPDDTRLSESFNKSAAKFGVRIVDFRQFVLSNDPRDRTQTNIPLLTSRPAHDVVFIADSYGDFARYVPYQTYASRLVVGSEGLIPAAWHWTWERHGAPQLNQRFDRLAKRRLSAEEWAGWLVVKTLTTAIKQLRTTEYQAIF